MIKCTMIINCLILFSKIVSPNEAEVFTIFTKGCNIRRFPLFNENIEKLNVPPPSIRNCSVNIPLVDANSTHLWVIETSLDIFGISNSQEFYCCYKSFRSENTLQNVTYGNCIEFFSITEVKQNFIRVQCYYFDEKVYENFFVLHNKHYYRTKTVKNNTYNVLIFGIESVSRMNFHRTMAKTTEYLRQKGSIEMKGFNKVGDNSYPNLFPLLMGHNLNFVKKSCYNKHGNYDNKLCPFVWDNYRRAGFYTALGSDSIAGLLGEYEYNFTSIPTDLYLQTVMYEGRHLFKNQHYNYHQCLGSKYFYKILLEYITGLAENMKSNKLFGIFWEESVSHEHLDNPYIMDEDYLQLLISLEDSSYLSKSIIIFISDHGMRWGDFVQTEQGRQEERLPLLQFLFPESFKRKYKNAIRNLQLNSERLTTPYDMYLTLMDLIDSTVLEDKNIGMRSKSTMSQNMSTSLFLPVSRRRNCASVGIKEHWCSCYKGKKLRVGNLLRILAAQYVINHVNKLLEPYDFCQSLTIGKIIEATVVKNGKIQVYNVILEAFPGGAILDGTVLRDKDNWKVSGIVTRLNRFNNSICISDATIKMYCYCK